MQGCTEKVGFDLDGVRSRIGSVQGSMRRMETMSARFKLRLDEVVMEDVPALLDEVVRLGKLEGIVVSLLNSKKRGLIEIRRDIAQCVRNGWDEGHERLENEEMHVVSEIAMLEKVLRDAR